MRGIGRQTPAFLAMRRPRPYPNYRLVPRYGLCGCTKKTGENGSSPIQPGSRTQFTPDGGFGATATHTKLEG